MLDAYLTRTQQLLNNPQATAAVFSIASLTGYINTARGQVAGESESIRVFGTLALTLGTQSYPFSSIDVSSVAGVAGVFTTRGATINIGSGSRWLRPRSFPYFMLYYLDNPVPEQGTPIEVSQYAQGENGSLYFNPTPDIDYTANLDCVCVPAALTSDSDPEALPYPWTDAVPYFAAYLAYTSAQRSADADRMWGEYEKFAGRARQMSNGAVNPSQFPQAGNPVLAGQLGMQQRAGGQ